MDTATCSILTPNYDPPKSYHSSFVRDYVLDNDGEGMRKAMEQIASEEEAIRLHNETLKAMEDAALARAMELSKETALREAMHRACRPEIHTSPCPSRNQDGHQTVKQDQISYLATASSVTLVSTDSSTERSNQMSKAIEWSQMSNSGGKPDEPYGDYSFTGSSSLRISAFPRTSGSNQATEQLGNKSNHAMSSWRTGVSSCSDSSVSSSSKSSERDSSHADSICKLREDSFVSSDQTSLSKELLTHVGFFVSPQKCSRCDGLVERIRGSRYVFGLHAICTCGACYCRGCFAEVDCSTDCPGGEGCSVKNCCCDIRVIMVFDSLSTFNVAFLAMLREFGPDVNLVNFVCLFMRRRNPSVHQFERILTDTLRALPRILQPLDADLHPSVIRLFSLSYLPQVIHCFLRHEDIGDWIMHAETYLAILDAMKELPACGLRPIFSERLTCDRKWGHEVPLGKGLGTGDNQWFCLKDTVTHLEVHYKRFTALSSRITFPSTLFKLHQLIDGILFLLMQQITD